MMYIIIFLTILNTLLLIFRSDNIIYLADILFSNNLKMTFKTEIFIY